jgi:uncharacterized protein YjbI with pentapeptide repeats
MRQLDAKRNSFLIRFLQNAHLNGAELNIGNTIIVVKPIYNIISFDRADLSDIDFRGTYLGEANLSGANLDSADLHDAILYKANLRNAELRDANLTNAHNLTQQQLDQVYDCYGATLPQGLTCHHNLSAP